MRELSSKNYTVYAHPEKRALDTVFNYGQANLFGRHIFKWEHSKGANSERLKYRIKLPNQNQTFYDAITQSGTTVYFGMFSFGQVIRSLAENGFNDERMTIGFKLFRNIEVPFGYPFNSIQKSIALCNKTAFVDYDNNLHHFYKSNRWKHILPRRKLYHGKITADHSITNTRLVEFYGSFYHYIQFLRKDLDSLVRSGIWDEWNTFLEKSHAHLLFKTDLAKKHSKNSQFYDSNLASLFYIFLVSLLFAANVLVCELVISFCFKNWIFAVQVLLHF